MPWEAGAGTGDWEYGLGGGVAVSVAGSGMHEMKIIDGLELRINDKS